MLYELAMLRSPFQPREGADATLVAIFEAIVAGDYPPVDTRCYSEELAGLVRRMLALDPADRPDIDEVASAALLAARALLQLGCRAAVCRVAAHCGQVRFMPGNAGR